MVKQLLNRVRVLPFDVVELLCDRSFYNAACIQRFGGTTPVVLRVIRRVQQMAEKPGTSVYWTEYAMYKGSERELRFPLAIYISCQQ